MASFLHAAAISAAVILAPFIPAIAAENQADAAANVKLTDAQCTALWSKAVSGATGDLAMDKAQPYVKDFKAADANADSKLSAAEWNDACAKGLIKSDTASTGASTGASGQDQGATSDRTPGGSQDREHGSTSAGAPGVEHGQTPEGTSDRTPNK